MSAMVASQDGGVGRCNAWRLALCALLGLWAVRPAEASWTRVGTFLVGNNGTGSATYAPTTSATLEAGNVGVCVIAKDETGNTTTDGPTNNQFLRVADAAGNIWIKAYEQANANSTTAADGAIVAIWYTHAATTLASGAAVTFTFSASTTRKGVTCDEYTITGAAVSIASGANGIVNDAADPGSMTVATGVAAEHLFIRGSACESNNTGYTPDADYTGFGGSTTTSTSNSGTAATSMGARGESRIASEATSAASDPAYVSADCASAMVALNEGAQTGFYLRSRIAVTAAGSGTTLSQTVALNIAAGDVLVAFLKGEAGSSAAPYSIAKASGGSPANAFTCDEVQQHTATTAMETAVCHLTSATADSLATFEATWNVAMSFRDFTLVVVRPQSGETVTKDGASSATGTGTAITTGNITTTGTDEVVFGFVGEFQASSATAQQIGGVAAEVFPPIDASSVWYRFATLSAQQATATVTSVEWCAHIIALKSESGAPPACTPFLAMGFWGCR